MSPRFAPLFVFLAFGLLAACPGTPRGGDDDDDAADDDDDSAGADDDDAVGDDDDAVGDDDDAVGDDDDAVGDDDDTPTGPCTDDGNEEDDTLAAATPTTPGSYTNFVACPDDYDWFAVTVPAGQQLTVDVLFSDAEGDIDAGIYDADENNLDNATSTDDNETAGPVLSEAGETLYVRVSLFADAGVDVGNPYDLEITVAPPPSCPVDSFEENDSDASPATLTAGSYPNLAVCEEDEDWYAIQLTAGQTIDVDLTFAHAEGDIDLGLEAPDGSSAASSVSVSDDEHVSYVVATTGTHLVRVYLYNDTGSVFGNDYGMEVTVQ